MPHISLDTSAWSKARNDPVLTALFNDAVRQGLIATCEVVTLELLRSALNRDRFNRQSRLLANLTSCPVGAAEVERALDVQAALARKGHHRGVKPADLLIAAAAESAGLALLHYDHDYDVIADATGQPATWIARRGSLT